MDLPSSAEKYRGNRPEIPWEATDGRRWWQNLSEYRFSGLRKKKGFPNQNPKSSRTIARDRQYPPMIAIFRNFFPPPNSHRSRASETRNSHRSIHFTTSWQMALLRRWRTGWSRIRGPTWNWASGSRGKCLWTGFVETDEITVRGCGANVPDWPGRACSSPWRLKIKPGWDGERENLWEATLMPGSSRSEIVYFILK